MKEDKQFNYKKLVIGILSFILIIAGIVLYSRYIGTTGLVTKEYKIVANNLPKEYHGLKIVHISDVHYGSTINEKEFDKIINETNLLKPDIVVITGDLIDDNTDLSANSINTISKQLSKINTTINKYIITGNHDYNHEDFNKIVNKSNFVLLDDTYDIILKDGLNPIIISGISTNLHDTKTISEKTDSFDKYINGFSGDENLKIDESLKPVYSILLIHEPDFIDELNLNNYDLILAGHSHNGQVRLPFIGAIVKPLGAKKYYKEYYKVNNTDLYISSGLGTSTYKFRLFNRPSINFYRLVNN